MVRIMANYNIKAKNKNLGLAIVMSVFAVIGLACIIIGYGSEFLSWMKTFGVVILVLSFPVVLFILYRTLVKKVKDM